MYDYAKSNPINQGILVKRGGGENMAELDAFLQLLQPAFNFLSWRFLPVGRWSDVDVRDNSSGVVCGADLWVWRSMVGASGVGGVEVHDPRRVWLTPKFAGDPPI